MNWIRLLIVGLLAFCASHLPGAEEPLPVLPATEPPQAAATIRLQNGFRAELIAAEPLVTDPVDIAYDENGLAYVAEMNDYPYVDPTDDKSWALQQSAPIGRIRVLEDTDGDGIFDRSDIFAEGLSWPSGIACWKGGIYVAATPDLLYLKDTDGDRRADVRRVVFKGFQKYNVQAIMNNPKWGLDHRIYVAGSSNGGQIVSDEQASHARPVELGRNDFCFDPANETLEVLSGSGRFGNTFDDWGNRFLTNIRNPIQHIVFPARYLRRNKYLMLSSTLQDVASSGDAVPVYRVSPPESWRVINAERASRSASPALVDTAAATGYVTSSSGVTIYRGAAYPDEFQGNAFVGEVAGNLVIRYVLEPSGVSFTGQRPYQKADFMASTDNWFRPVNFANAPDGTLHVLDMYRQTVEHPWSLPDDLKKRLDLTAGRNRGRIYRLVPAQYAAGFKPPPPPRLGSAATIELVALLENPNGWWRETAHRLLYELQDSAAIEPLKALLRNSASSCARLHALWSLQGLSALTDDDAMIGLNDTEPRVQVHAVQLSEPFLGKNSAILSAVKKLADASDAPLRFQVALSLGEAPPSEVESTLAQLLLRDGRDSWICSAALSSMEGQEQSLLRRLLNNSEELRTDVGQSVALQVAVTVGTRCTAGQVQEILDLAAVLPADFRPFQERLALGLGKGLKRQRITLESLSRGEESRGVSLLRKLLEDVQTRIRDTAAMPEQRVALMALLEYAEAGTAIATLEPLISPRTPAVLQQAAISLLGTFPDRRIPRILVDRYPSLTSAQQQLVVNQLMAQAAWLPILLESLESGAVDVGRVPAVRQEIYMLNPDPAIRSQATQIFQRPGGKDVAEIVTTYQRSLPANGDRQRGLTVYQKNCANCHKLAEQGYEVGPHLSTVKSRSRDELLVSILDPNREIAPNFLAYLVATKDGLQRTGVVSAETNSSITLRGTEKNETIIFRDDIEEFQNSKKSLMPVGLEKVISPDQMADLIELLKSQ